jgi:hypothetical protein
LKGCMLLMTNGKFSRKEVAGRVINVSRSVEVNLKGLLRISNQSEVLSSQGIALHSLTSKQLRPCLLCSWIYITGDLNPEKAKESQWAKTQH